MTRSRLPVAGFAGLACFLALAIAAQRTILAKAKATLLADPGVRAKAVGLGTGLRALASSLGAREVLILCGMAALVVAAVVLERRRRAVGRFLESVFETRDRTALLVMLLATLTQVWVFDTGPLLRHDAHAQTGVTALLAESRDLSWSFRWYGGYPLLAAYGSGFHVVAAQVTRQLGSLEWGIKTVLLLGAILTALGTWRFVSRLGCRPAVAVLAGLAPLLSFQHTHTLAWSGKFPEALLYGLFPWLLAEAWDMARAPSLRSVAGFSLAGGAMAVVHLPLGALGCVVASVFAVAASFCRPAPRPVARTIAALAFSALLILAIGSPIALGVAEERGWILLGRNGLHGGGVADFGLPSGGSLADLLVWRQGWTGDVHAYLGLTLVAGGLGGAVYAARCRRDGGAPALAAIAASVAMLGGGYLASRASEYLVTLLAVGLALGLDTSLAAAAAASRKPRLTVGLACALLVTDLGPTLVQAPGAAAHAASAAHLALMKAQADGGRYLRTTRRGDTVGIDDTDNAVEVDLDSPLGAHHYMGPNTWTAFTLALVNEARASLGRDDERAAAALRGLAFDGVTVIGEDRRTEFGAPLALPRGLVTKPGDRCVRLPAGGPVTFADAVEAAPPELREALDRAPFSLYEKEWRAADTPVRAAARTALARMELDPASPRAARVFVADASQTATELLSARGARGSVDHCEPGATRWTVLVRMEAPGAVRLAVAWSPRLRVLVNGAVPRISPVPDVTGGTILLLPQGTWQVDVTAAPAAASSAWGISGFVAVACVLVLRLRRPGTGQTDRAAPNLPT